MCDLNTGKGGLAFFYSGKLIYRFVLVESEIKQSEKPTIEKPDYLMISPSNSIIVAVTLKLS
jgi:hypothetical protein